MVQECAFLWEMMHCYVIKVCVLRLHLIGMICGWTHERHLMELPLKAKLRNAGDGCREHYPAKDV